MKIGCIGDDFTGSGDLANTLAKQGMPSALYCGIPRVPAAHGVEAGVVALKSRTKPVAEAVAESLAALEWLQDQGCTQFFFKYCSTFDSTADGNIGPVADALAEALEARQVIFCPAFPGAGRSLHQGYLFVQDRLLNESGMERHPLTPMTDPDIRRCLARQTRHSVGHVASTDVFAGPEAISVALDREAADGHLHIVVDAIRDEDLMAIGAAAKALSLITGGSGLAMGLPGNFGYVPATPAWTPQAGDAAILSGSCSTATRAQVALHKASHPAIEITAEDVMDGRQSAPDLAAWAIAQTGLPLIYSSADPDDVAAAQARYGRARLADTLEQFFAELARRLVAGGVTRLITAGGETSGAIVEGLGLKALEIGPEIDPGVPALRAGPELVLALKSGNFGSEEFFSKAARMLGP